jgi:hypothetical protein
MLYRHTLTIIEPNLTTSNITIMAQGGKRQPSIIDYQSVL